MLLSTMCKSLSGLSVPLVTITDFECNQIPIIQRKLIVIVARIHPGETSGSWVMDGIINYLSSNTELLKKMR